MFSPTLVHEYLTGSAALHPEKEALIYGRERLTYRDIDARSSRIAEHLIGAGLKRQERVVIFMDNCPEAVISIYGTLKAGGIFVLLNGTLKSKKLGYILRDSGASVLIAHGSKSSVVKEAVHFLNPAPQIVWVGRVSKEDAQDRADSWEEIFRGFDVSAFQEAGGERKNERPRLIDYDLATLIYTSGSTGEPKGVMSSHFNMVSAARSIIQYLGNRDDDRIIVVLPLSFDYGLYQVIMAFMYGGTVVLEKNFQYSVRILETLQREKVTGFPIVPTVAALLLKMRNLNEYDMQSLRYMTNTGARLPEEHIRQLQKLFPHIRIFSMFGLTECKRVSFLPPDELERRPGSVGIAIPNCEVYIVDENGREVPRGETGELVVRGANVMRGYWNAPELTAKIYRPGRFPGETVLYTGDLFRADEEGYLYFLGRMDDMIKTKGERASPKEIENLLCECNGVADAAVIGVPDEIMGQAIKAFIVPKSGRIISQRDILRYCAGSMEPLMVPKHVEFIKDLPTTPNGKIDKKALLERSLVSRPIPQIEPGIRIQHAHVHRNMLLSRILLNTCDRFPDNVAVVHAQERISYRDLQIGAAKVAGILHEYGVRRGDRVLIALENSVEYLMSYFGVHLAGGVTVSINPDIKPAGLQKIALDCSASGIIAKPSILPLIEAWKGAYSFRYILLHGQKNSDGPPDTPIVPVEDYPGISNPSVEYFDRKEDELASIIYTSGTTGGPKGVMLSHKNLANNTKSIVEYLDMTGRDSVMVVLPFYYSYGNSLLLTHVMQGGKLVLDNRFIYPNLVLDNMEREKVTGFAGVPSTFAILLHRSKFRNMSFPSLRYITQAGGPMPHETAMEIANILPHAKLFIMYGQTEAAARLSYLPPEFLARKHGSVGKGIPGVRLEVLKENGEKAKPGEVGEVVAEGDNIMHGYWGREEETRKVLRNGKLFTGDMATVDEEGFIYIRGRRTDIIKSGAHRIAPREIEEFLLKHPLVEEAAVVGEPDPILGEEICAFLVLKEGGTCADKEILHFCHENLPGYMVPKTVRFVRSFPKTESGKIKKEELKTLLANPE